MALALKENKSGIIETFELDENFAKAALENFRRYNVFSFVKLILGDARKTSAACGRDYDIYFLDSLHTKDFANWFIESHILPAENKNALFHMHDVMPVDATVRCWSAPPIEGTPLDPAVSFKQKVKRAIKKLLSENDVAETDELIPINMHPPRSRGELPTYDGNRTTEAIFGNELVKFMNGSEYVFVHNLIKEYPQLEPGKYNSKVIARKDAAGDLLEWNESLWCYSEPLKEAHKRVNSL